VSGNGTLIGQVLDQAGNKVSDLLVTLHRSTEEDTFAYDYTYAADPVNPITSDDLWQENLLIGEIPAGAYRVAARINGDTVVESITIREGEITWVWLQQTE
jgi:hypothetical protein